MDIKKNTIKYKNDCNQMVDAIMYNVLFKDFSDIKNTMDKELVDIAYADSAYELGPAKKEMSRILKTYTEKQRYGSVAELFAHVVLRKLGYIQQCLFRNLEESSMKKGFDGLYKDDDIFWIMESKSSFKGNTKHQIKIKEAIDDLKDKIENVNKNNPWMNAVHHIAVLQNGKGDASLKKRITKLSSEYMNGVNHTIDEFNIIPVSTLFFDSNYMLNDIIKALSKLFEGKKYNKIIVICIDNYIFHDFISYLEE